MKQVYLDYSATTPIKEEVLEAMLPVYKNGYGNPSSLYTLGLEAKALLDKAREKVASSIGASGKEIFFTGCGSEADNWALIGVANKLKNKGKHIITSKIEHHAILHTCEYLEKQGYEITYLDVTKDGFVKPETLKAAIRKDTILVSIMFINNEVGTIQPIKELAKIAKENGVLFHTDGVQALGSIPIDVKDLGIDMMSMSAHKIYGPKGVGALYIRKGLRIDNYLHGGAQEMGKRAGTENLPSIVGFGKAAELVQDGLEEHIKKLTKLRDYTIDEILKRIPKSYLNGSRKNRHPGNINITFEYIEGEAILLLLDNYGISVATGSACASKSLNPSHVLDAMGVPWEMIHGTVRITLGDMTTKEDIDYFIEHLAKTVEVLRKLSPVDEKKGWN